MKSKKMLLILIGLALIITIAIIYYLGRSGNGKGDRDISDPAGRHARRGDSTYMQMLDQFAKNIPPEKVLEDYKASSIYPPNSRPLTRKNIDLLEPNRRYEVPLPVKKDSDLYYLFTADKYRVMGNDTITFQLFVTQGRSLGSDKLEVSINKASLLKGYDTDTAKLVSRLEFTNDGNNSYTCTVPPAKTSEWDYQGRFLMLVEFTVEGESGEGLIPFEYSPEKRIPAAFTGEFSEEIKDGSLYIYAGVNVYRAGFYIFDANLYDKNGEPVAYTRSKKKLSTGRSKVPLYFFGKVFRDQHAESPFSLKDLRGFRFIEVTTADRAKQDREVMRVYDGTYKTREYSEDTFSDEEYDSAYKRKKLDLLKKGVMKIN